MARLIESLTPVEKRDLFHLGIDSSVLTSRLKTSRYDFVQPSRRASQCRGIDRYHGPIDFFLRLWPNGQCPSLSKNKRLCDFRAERRKSERVSISMNEHELFSGSIYEEQTQLAERELSSFIAGVTKAFGPEQGQVSMQDWLDEAEMMDSPPRSTSRDWCSVTIAAWARLASRIDATQDRQESLTRPAQTKVLTIPSSNCFSSILLF
jgi:hypothetical protein